MKRLLLAAALALAACSDNTGPTPRASGGVSVPATSMNRTWVPRNGFVTVAAGVRLHYIDFGGTGEPILLLAGLGNTAHVFEHFAPRLTDRFHVIALTRRGFGASTLALDGYDTRSLSEDIRVVLDSLRLARVNLVGHSVAGDEMTRFAGDHPDRVSKMVYLDGAYDRIAIQALLAQYPPPPPPDVTVDDVASLRAFSRYVARVRGVELPRTELTAQWIFAADGSLLGEVTPVEVYLAILAGEERPDYSRVVAPALGIFAVADTPRDFTPWVTPKSAAWASLETLLQTVYSPFYRGQREQFDAGVPRSTRVDLHHANHYVFISDADRVERELRSFLDGKER